MNETAARMRLGTPCAFVLACLQGCGSMTPPPPPRSDLVIPATWQGSGGSNALSVAWWNSFGDPVLTGLVERAVVRNTDLRMAAARVAEARALDVAQRAALWPTLDAGLGASRSQSISEVFLVPYIASGRELQFQAAYEVDVWGRVEALNQSADALLLASEAMRDSVKLSVAAATASAYINLRALDGRLEIAEATLVSRDAARRVAAARERVGYASSLEAAQAEAEYRSTAQVVPQLRQAAARQEHAICVLLGDSPRPINRGLDVAAIDAPPLVDAGVPSDLLRRRPDIAGAEAQVAASDGQLAAARARLLPSIQLTASFGRVGSTILREGPFSIWSLGGSVLAPIFNGGHLRAQVDASGARRDQALIGYERTVLAAFAEVEDQLVAVVQLKSQLDEAMAQRQAVADALRIAHNRYRAGYASYLEELDAQRTLFSAEQTSVQLRADLLVANVNLFRALGGGWR